MPHFSHSERNANEAFTEKNTFYSVRLSESASLGLRSAGKAMGDRPSHTLLMVVDTVMNSLWRDTSEYLPKLLVKMESF